VVKKSSFNNSGTFYLILPLFVLCYYLVKVILMENILKVLNDENIDYRIIKHKRVYTIEEIKDINLDKEGLIPKNIFLRNANGKVHYLVTCHPDKKIDIKSLANNLNSTRLSFASSERLKKYLNVCKGSVSPLGFIYDENSEVIFVF